MAEKERGSTGFVEATSHRDTESYSELQLHLSSSLPFHEQRDTFFCSTVQIYRHFPQMRKIHVHPEFSTPSEGCSPVQSQRLQSVYERVLSEGTRQFEELCYAPQNSLSSNVSEIATSF